ncbi:MAG: DUF362 domain-containing protein [Deltaproteobacteria bacterium]|nr:DUF362 domain-containing protein [Deltaproteobacteria bacterium]
MKSTVYFAPVKDAEDIKEVNGQLKKVLEKSKVLDIIGTKDKIGIKMHFGEAGNTGYVRPSHVRVICDAVARKDAVVTLADANTLYRGRRLHAEDHLALAREHGFTKKAIGLDVFIPDDKKEADITAVRIDQKHIETAKVARLFIDVDALVSVSHFKGHALTGFGGAIKNIGMGCATREGKLAQHCDAAPMFYTDRCNGCGECELVCPAEAISMENDTAVLDRTKCIGCASCVAACSRMAIFIDVEAGDAVQEKMAEYALAVLRDKKEKSCFLNFALRISQECDCWPYKNPRIAPDVGIFASLDPVAIDKASFDLVNQASGKDVFKQAHPKEDGLKQLRHAQNIGLGTMEYDLIHV